MDSREAIGGHRTERSNYQADPHSPAYTTSGAGQMLRDLIGFYRELSQPLCRAGGGGIGNELGANRGKREVEGKGSGRMKKEGLSPGLSFIQGNNHK